MILAEVPEDHRERRFTGEYAARSDSARTALTELLGTIAEAEAKDRAQRQSSDAGKPRRRRASAQAKFEAAVAAVVCELIAHHASGHTSGVFVPRTNAVLKKPDQYRAEAINALLPDALDWLERIGFITQVKGYLTKEGERRRTVVTVGPALLELIERHALGADDIGRDRVGVIVLRSKRPDGTAEDIPFNDDGDTNRMRAEVDAYNLFLADADLKVLLDDTKLVAVDLGNRRLRRIFSRCSFASGGRHYGGFWQDMKGHLRLERMLIEGEHVAELDFAQAGLRILYGLAKAEPPKGDLYLIPEFKHLKNGRDDVKSFLSAATFVEDPTVLAPIGKRLCPHIAAQQNSDLGDFGDAMIDDLAVKEALGAIKRHHAAVAHFLPSLIGHRVQNIESNVMMRALLDLMGKNIVALPIFDGVVVAKSKTFDAKAIMERAFKKIAGVDADVTLEWNPWSMATQK